MKSIMTAAATLLLTALTAQADSPLPVSSPEDQQVDPVRLERMHDLVESYVTEGKHAGAATMVIRNGKIIDWQSWGKANLATGTAIEQDTIYRIYSMTKVLTSVAVLQLFEQNKLLLSQPITDFIPELKSLKVYTGGPIDAMQLEEVKTPISIAMLLNHTAGFSYAFFNATPVHELYKKAGLWESNSYDEFLKRVTKLPLTAQPGEAFHYGISDDILALAVERISGMPFGEYIAQYITEPLKMHDTAFYVPEQKRHRLAAIHKPDKDGKLVVETKDLLGAYAEKGRGIPSGGGGMFSTIGDYARFAQCLLNGGKLDDVRILGRKIVELALQNSLPEGAYAFIPTQGWGLISGLQTDMAGSLLPVSEGTFSWSGAATTHFFADPAEKLIALVFTQHFPYDEHQLFPRFKIAVYQALK